MKSVKFKGMTYTPETLEVSIRNRLKAGDGEYKIKLSELLCLRNQFKDEKHEELTEFEGEVD
jgi:hypothetical protein